MITDAIIQALLGGISALIGLMPAYALPSQLISDNSLIVGQYAAGADKIFPLTTVINIIGLALTLKVLMLGADLIIWIYHQFWGSA